MEAILALAKLIEIGMGAMQAAQQLQQLMKNAQEQGREVTLDELKEIELSDDRARDALVAAIEEAERESANKPD